MQELRPAADAASPGINAYVQNIPTIRIGGRLSKSQYQYTLQAPDTAELYEWAPQLEAKLRTLPGLADVTSDLQITQPQITVDIDRNKASALGVSAQAIESTLYDAYGARQVSTIFAPTNQYWVVMELEPRYQTDPSVLSLLYVRSSTRRARAAERGGDAEADRRPARDQSPGTAAVRHDLVRSAARRRAVAGDRGDQGRDRRDAACRRRSSARSRAPRRRSSRRCAAWASCSCSRSS